MRSCEMGDSTSPYSARTPWLMLWRWHAARPSPVSGGEAKRQRKHACLSMPYCEHVRVRGRKCVVYMNAEHKEELVRSKKTYVPLEKEAWRSSCMGRMRFFAVQ